MRRLASLGLCLASTGCLAARALAPDPMPAGGRVVHDLAYRDVSFGDDARRLDVFVPPGDGPHPVVVFVHGGFWVSGGRKAAFGVYERLGHRLAQAGVLGVVISYRLAPAHRHPAQISDVAAAIATAFDNVAQYGGDPQRVFVMGHSAGAHLALLAALDRRWLAAEGASPRRIAGVIGLSGVYDLPDLATRGRGKIRVPQVFGSSAEVWKQASPVTHVAKRTPRILLADGDEDYLVVREETAWLREALVKAGAPVEYFRVNERNHEEVIVRFGEDEDPLAERVLAFVSGSSR
ncbi:MAG: alpha/beta hydrolase [Deltaproteobacteria bacterium]